MANRRSFLQSAVGIGAGLFTTDKLFASSKSIIRAEVEGGPSGQQWTLVQHTGGHD